MRAEFDELRAIPHKGEKGQAGEAILAQFLADHLPNRFGIGAGFVIDRADSISPQIDVLVYDAFNCPRYRVSDRASIFPADNVAAVVEVKSRLSKESIRDAWLKISAVKELRRAKTKGEQLSKPIGVLFAFASDISLETAEGHYRDLFRAEGLLHHIDVIAVLDQGVLMLAAKPRNGSWAPAIIQGLPEESEGCSVATTIHFVKNSTLDVIVRLMLAHLVNFRSIVDHPGFAWGEALPMGMATINYLASISNHPDVAERARLEELYRGEVLAEMASLPRDFPG